MSSIAIGFQQYAPNKIAGTPLNILNAVKYINAAFTFGIIKPFNVGEPMATAFD